MEGGQREGGAATAVGKVLEFLLALCKVVASEGRPNLMQEPDERLLACVPEGKSICARWTHPGCWQSMPGNTLKEFFLS